MVNTMHPSGAKPIPPCHYRERRLYYSEQLRELVEGKYVRLGLADDPFERSEVFGYIDFPRSDLPEVLMVKPLPGLLHTDDILHKVYSDTVFHLALMPPPDALYQELTRRVVKRATYHYAKRHGMVSEGSNL